MRSDNDVNDNIYDANNLGEVPVNDKYLYYF